ncbi:MAG: tetratricopeptide repeat protein, partial [Acidobacteria bacterium]|nr:tetratricopeptide repeat protein [Acidobacteriota bacterium]
NPGMEQAWYRLGIAYMNWSKAAGLDLVDAAPPSPYGNILLAELQAVAGIVGDAEKNYRRAVETMPDWIEARLALGRFFLDLEKSPERRTAARAQLETAKSIEPGDLRVALAMTRLALADRNYADALARLGEILETDAPFALTQLPTLLAGFSPQELQAVISGLLEQQGGVPDKRYCAAAHGPVPALLYAAYLELGDTRQAEECWRSLSNQVQAVESEARRDHPGLNSYSHRLEQLEQASNSRPLALAERQELALCAFHVGEYERALRALVEILNHSENRPAQYWLSHACRALAREAFLQAIRLNPDSYRTHLLLADLANDRHDTAQALEEYEKAVSLGAADPEVHILLVQFFRSKGRADEALAKAQVAVQKFPAHPRLNCELGQLLLGMKKPLDAARRFERSLAADPSLAEARAGLADSYAALGETEKAVREMKQALSDDPDGSYHYRLGRWLQMSGRTREAADAFSVSTELKQERSRKERERFLSIRRGT